MVGLFVGWFYCSDLFCLCVSIVGVAGTCASANVLFPTCLLVFKVQSGAKHCRCCGYIRGYVKVIDRLNLQKWSNPKLVIGES